MSICKNTCIFSHHAFAQNADKKGKIHEILGLGHPWASCDDCYMHMSLSVVMDIEFGATGKPKKFEVYVEGGASGSMVSGCPQSNDTPEHILLYW